MPEPGGARVTAVALARAGAECGRSVFLGQNLLLSFYLLTFCAEFSCFSFLFVARQGQGQFGVMVFLALLRQVISGLHSVQGCISGSMWLSGRRDDQEKGIGSRGKLVFRG